jgi:hypothetical protein
MNEKPRAARGLLIGAAQFISHRGDFPITAVKN